MASKCSMLRTWTSTQQTSSSVPPAASTAALMFSQTCRVCSVISPVSQMLPSGRRAVMPDMNTNRPVASIAVAWEKTPFGCRSLGLEICTLGMALFLHRVTKWSCQYAEFACEAGQHGDDGRLKLDAAARPFAPAPFWFTRREQLLYAGCTLADAYSLGGCGRVLSKPVRVAKMRHVDSNK